MSATDGDPVASPRALALLGIAALTAGYLHTLHWATTVGGGTALLAGTVVVALGAAIALRSRDERIALPVTAVLGGLCAVWYFWTAFSDVSAVLDVASTAASDTATMLRGTTILGITDVGVWAAATAPVPVFLSWYLALRRRYVTATVAGGSLLLFLVLTGDGGAAPTLAGSLGAAAAVGFGEFDLRDGSVAQADGLVVLIGLLAVVGLFAPMVVGGHAVAGDGGGEGDADGTLDEQLLAGDEIEAAGAIELSPEVRFVVEADEPRRWRSGSLDRYTGDGWVRTGGTSAYDGELDGPPGETRPVGQRVELYAPTRQLPAAAVPVEVGDAETESAWSPDGGALGSERGSPDSIGAADIEGGDTAAAARVTDHGGIAIEGGIGAGNEYVVRSEVVDASTDELQDAGTDYPDEIEERYLQLPESTPDRVGDLTAEVSDDAETPYETAVVVESFLENHRPYSLDVEEPEGDMVDAFLFEMEAGYCTYYASAMTVMLRNEGIPARTTVGYNPGQAIDDDTRVVRGTDAHAWVEVYFPETGWVEFDPTPAAEWEQVHHGAVSDARQEGNPDVDIDASEDVPIEEELLELNETIGDVEGAGALGEADGLEVGGVEGEIGEEAGGFGESLPFDLPGLGQLALAALAIVGGVAGARRTGVAGKIERTVSIHYQRRVEPEQDVERAVDRMETLLAEHYEPRRETETVREYRDRLPSTVDPRVERVYEVHERARYRDGIDQDVAEETVRLVDELASEDAPLLSRLQILGRLGGSR